MPTVKDLCTELTELSQLIKTRKGKGQERLYASVVQSLQGHMNQLSSFTTSDAATMQVQLNGLDLPGVLHDRIEALLDDRLSKVTPVAVQKARLRKRQRNKLLSDKHKALLETPCMYLTSTDWDVLNDKRVLAQGKYAVFYNRFNLLGITSFDEHTVGWCIAVILKVLNMHTGRWPSYTQILSMVVEFKRCYDSHRTPWTLPVRPPLTYPDTPEQLDKSIFENAYKADDPPIRMDLGNLHAVMEHVPLRKSSKLVRNEEFRCGDTVTLSQWKLAQMQIQDTQPQHCNLQYLTTPPRGNQQLQLCDKLQDPPLQRIESLSAISDQGGGRSPCPALRLGVGSEPRTATRR